MRSVSRVLLPGVDMMVVVPQESFFLQSRFQATDSVGFTADLAEYMLASEQIWH